MKDDDLDQQWIERRILTGMILSTEYLQELAKTYKPALIESSSIKVVAGWCLSFFEKYNRAPGKDIEGIYNAKLKAGLNKDRAEAIEDILSGLSDEYGRGQFNLEYLQDESRQYFSERRLKTFMEDIQGEISTGSITEAEKMASTYMPDVKPSADVVNPFSADAVHSAFESKKEPLITFGKALGRMWDNQFFRGGFVALMGPEKRGKSFWLMEIAMRGLVTGCNVVFFQAGDMSRDEQTMRMCNWTSKRSNDPKYCKPLYVPVIDCQLSQCNKCKDHQSYQVFPKNIEFDAISPEELFEAYANNHEKYQYCKNNTCKRRRPAMWFVRRPEVDPLTENEAKRIMHKFNARNDKQFKLVTYPNGTLSIREMNALMDTWEKQEGFVPDLIVIDYADILVADDDTLKYDWRNQENIKWRRLRGMSQSRHSLVITATQTDTDSYDRELLGMKNFSETKTKYAHVTAMYGLNQSDAEKEIGLMRINEIVIRQGDFDRRVVVNVLQRLQMGRPYLGSF